MNNTCAVRKNPSQERRTMNNWIRTNVLDQTDKYVLELALPGISKEEVSLDIKKHTLTIKAKRNQEQDLKYLRKEIKTGTFERKFKLPENVDQENVQAKMNNGILQIELQKVAEKQQTIQIK